MKLLHRILRSSLATRLLSAIVLAGAAAYLERNGWRAPTLLWLIVAGSIGAGLVRQRFQRSPPAVHRRALSAGA